MHSVCSVALIMLLRNKLRFTCPTDLGKGYLEALLSLIFLIKCNCLSFTGTFSKYKTTWFEFQILFLSSSYQLERWEKEGEGQLKVPESQDSRKNKYVEMNKSVKERI